jgi:hypothetical protein
MRKRPFSEIQTDSDGNIQVSVHQSADNEDGIYRRIQMALGKAPKLLTIELIGHGALTTDLCLGLFHLLKTEKKSPTKVLLKVNSSLIDGAVLLFCCADQVTFAPHRFFRIASAERFREILEKCRDSAGVVEDVEENASLSEYEEILKILNAYLPVEEFTDQQVPVQKLAEYFGDEQEARFKELLGQVGNSTIPAEENLV